jgi:ribosomal protein S8
LLFLQKEGYIRGIKKSVIEEKEVYHVLLKYTEFHDPIIKKIKRISTPGKRIFVKSKGL